ncbi:MAG: hypothetical protein IT384_01750 [Deltaproteobacteria bacterium]|nr:hypothetical protein [Deltaproteobacteria bacterium]
MRPLSALGRWEIIQLRPRHLRTTHACTELEAAQALAGAYLFAYWRSVKGTTTDGGSRRLLSREVQFLEDITQAVERESVQRSSRAFGRAAQELAKVFAALEVLNTEIAGYAARLGRISRELLDLERLTTDRLHLADLG